MSVEKNTNARIQHKHDIEANWSKATNFIPKAGELVIYDADENYTYARIKIGDGVTAINDLGFIDETKADKDHTHDDRYYTETEIDEKLVVFDDRIIATEENIITDVINIFTPADAGKFLCVAEDGSIKAVAFTDVSEVGA